MAKIIEIVSYPINTLYDDKVNEIDQAFRYEHEMKDKEKNPCSLKLIVRVAMIIALAMTCLQTYYYFDQLIQLSWISMLSLYLTPIAILMTILSVSPSYQPYVLLRKWTHSINSLLFFAYFWQALVYWTVLYNFLESKKTKYNEFMITINQRVIVWPHVCLIINFALTDWILLSQHANMALKAYLVYQLWSIEDRFKQMHKSYMHAFTYEGTSEIVVYMLLFSLLYIPQWIMVKTSQKLRGRSIDYTKHEEESINADKKKKKK